MNYLVVALIGIAALALFIMPDPPKAKASNFKLTASYNITACGARTPVKVDVTNLKDMWIPEVSWTLRSDVDSYDEPARTYTTTRLQGLQTKTACVERPPLYMPGSSQLWVDFNNAKLPL